MTTGTTDLTEVTPVKMGDSLVGGVHPFDTEKILVDPANPRKRFRRIAALAESMKEIGQTSPGKVTLLVDNPRYVAKLLNGERRYHACKLAGITFDAYVTADTLSPFERLMQALGANFNQERHDLDGSCTCTE